LYGIPKLSVYAAQIYGVYRKLGQIEEVLAWVSKFNKTLCPENIRAMEHGLKKLETKFKILLQQGALWMPTDEQCSKDPLCS